MAAFAGPRFCAEGPELMSKDDGTATYSVTPVPRILRAAETALSLGWVRFTLQSGHTPGESA
jgi:hypothetical protein